MSASVLVEYFVVFLRSLGAPARGKDPVYYRRIDLEAAARVHRCVIGGAE